MINFPSAYRAVVAKRRPVRQSLLMATLFAVQVAACASLLYWGYDHFRWQAVGWAIVSAVLVLIPDLQQSVSTALARVAANIVGALVGFVVASLLHQQGPLAVIVAMVAVSYICHVLRLDLGVRTACVAVIIVMTAHPGEIRVSVTERFSAVMIGCATGVTAQLIVLAIERKMLRPREAKPGVRADSSE